MTTDENPYRSPRASVESMMSPTPVDAKRKTVLGPIAQVAMHFAIALRLGPLLTCWVLVLSQPLTDRTAGGFLTTVASVPFMLIFALPLTIPFAVVSLLPAFFISMIENQITRRMAFMVAGLVVGTLIGMWASMPGTAFDNRQVVLPGVMLVGTVCGYLESLFT